MTVEPPDLTAMAQAAQTGKAGALDALLHAVLRHRVAEPSIRRYLFSEDDVQTAVQQTLVAVAFNLSTWANLGKVEPWIRQIAANEAKMLIRARDRRQSREHAAANETSGFVERMSSHLATQADLDRMMSKLEPRHAAAVLLRSSGLGYSEIAVQLGIAEGTAKTHVRAGRAELARRMATGTR